MTTYESELAMLTIYSHLFHALVSRGPRTSRSPTPPRSPKNSLHTQRRFMIMTRPWLYTASGFHSFFSGVPVGPQSWASCLGDISFRGNDRLHFKRSFLLRGINSRTIISCTLSCVVNIFAELLLVVFGDDL